MEEASETPVTWSYPPGRPSKVYVDALWVRGASLKTTTLSWFFSWPFTVYLIPFYHLKLSSGHLLLGAFPDPCAELRAVLPELRDPFYHYTDHCSQSWVTVCLLPWTQRSLRARIMHPEHGRCTLHTNKLMLISLPVKVKQLSWEIISQPLIQHLQGQELTPNWGIPYHIKSTVMVKIFFFILSPKNLPVASTF